ncbi:DUF305 domain-containing protein [Nocardioides sp. TRM66260-LWL]|uniref:DUF305 domain-containing protein n=1 Tax=Nocardioides sp. TRM66260-LWL TaxID=2874478 RepID=UPI001CC5E98D|nr:DUF305 domain-containing protein [Nocardioides sp. TRM66260-LWL]
MSSPHTQKPSGASEPSDREKPEQQKGDKAHERRMYVRFGLMIATSTVVMFVLMYSNVFAFDHVRWSEERFYMALLMGGAMALVMFAFMRSMMYKNRAYNLVLVAVALLLGAGGLYLSRSQALVDDQAYMKGMIPHHSIAILTSERADIDDARVRELADEIIKAQRKEIKEMDWLIEDIEKNGPATTQEEADQRPVPSFEGTAASSLDDVSDALAMLALFGVELL